MFVINSNHSDDDREEAARQTRRQRIVNKIEAASKKGGGMVSPMPAEEVADLLKDRWREIYELYIAAGHDTVGEDIIARLPKILIDGYGGRISLGIALGNKLWGETKKRLKESLSSDRLTVTNHLDSLASHLGKEIHEATDEELTNAWDAINGGESPVPPGVIRDVHNNHYVDPKEGRVHRIKNQIAKFKETRKHAAHNRNWCVNNPDLAGERGLDPPGCSQAIKECDEIIAELEKELAEARAP